MRFALLFVTLAACKQSAPAETHDAMTIDAAAVAMLTVNVRADGLLALNGFTVKDENELTELTRAIARDKPLVHAVIYVDKGVAYDRVIAAEGALKRGGVVHMAFGVEGTAPDASR